MRKFVDRFLALLLLVAAGLFVWQAILLYGAKPLLLFWSLNGGGLMVLASLLSFLRSFRPTDLPLALLSALALAGVIADCAAFALLTKGALLDPRPIAVGVLALLLILFSLVPALKPKAKFLPAHMLVRPKRRDRAIKA